ncbi:cysteine hydrolase family protein [Paraburkholderia hospita]|jgi:nicotinamidase-related amidase|uniref:Cysteine hydrolase n=1 Tax=Paraburkholderia hospita TaxID=169430 RepID=A0AAJ4X0G7_9BURK|nr:cysteine hydrolase family protein [Paraburkholderia hospita]EUC15106.1 isochorismatase hydrolase [Burkholderia sp. BT03]AUT69657.1 cysteine hydrolase [Paraburkholderia hospita]EIN00934.1 isochorismatase hydrolase [Paraburkholderia hospita]OUL77980.1 hydrolase [Paraburkholderia hospita]OUL88050.1 hydrolase [Paraburkholderia hospita]
MPGVAVIVIDVQQMFFSGPSPAYRGEEVIDGINRLTASARKANAPVFFVQHESDANGPLARGSDAWQLPATLVREQADASIHKTVGDSFHETPLADQLRQQGIDSVVICGYASEFCVNATARRAELLGLRTTIVADLHTTQDKPHLAADKIVEHQNFVWANSSMTGKRVKVRPLADILQTEFA